MSNPERRDRWKKSSYSNTGNGCVEVSRTLRAVRDSKQVSRPQLAGDVTALVSMIKGSRLNAYR